MEATKVERLVAPWYEALEEGKLLGRKCPECGHIEFPPRYACNDCGCMDTEWIEIDGKAVATAFIPQSLMFTEPRLNDEFGNFMWATIHLEGCNEIDDMNSVVVKVGPERLEELTAKLPVPVKPCIIQEDGYKALLWELDE